MKNILLFPLLLLFFLSSCKKEKEMSELDRSLSSKIPATAIHRLETPADLDILLEEIGDSRYVLLGEASHGTAEYYTWRAEITKRLIEEKGFTLIGVEGDWPDMYRLNEYIKGVSTQGASAAEVLQQTDRWPTWMWANEEIAGLGEWLRQHNQSAPGTEKVGFYGLDVYSLWDSMEEVLAYMEKHDAAGAQSARDALKCFAPYNGDEWAYAQATASNKADCADELAAMLNRLQQQQVNDVSGSEALFNATQNALVAINAERYFTTALLGNAASWNIRDRHMMQTINNLVQHHGSEAKIVVWEHNTHLGDARATDMAEAGMVNVGQLVREEHEDKGVYIVGYGSYKGSVVAASQWEAPRQIMKVPAAQPGSWEALLHNISPADKIILLKELQHQAAFMSPIGHRAIGVEYNPASERGNYVPSVLPKRYDAFLFIDETHALHPLSEESLKTELGLLY